MASAEAAGTAAVEGAVALALNKWKINVAKAQVKRAILLCEPNGAFMQFKEAYECI